MRDLEIRGAGDILGTRQHGHIAAVGFHLYTRLLTDSVTSLREQRDLPADFSSAVLEYQRPLVNVDLPINANIPSTYVQDKNMRLRLYRRIADLRSMAEIDAIFEEFSDRFGIPPIPVRNLLFQLRVKLFAEMSDVSSVSAENGQIVIRFRTASPPSDLPDLGRHVRIGSTALWMPYNALPDWPEKLVELFELLQSYQDRNKSKLKDFN
jgi:transcription-repair coupling factor (superfamily II helicase)